MTDRAFADGFDTTGEWFLPDAPGRQIAGNLIYTSTRTELYLIEAFRPLQGAIYAGDTQIYPLVHGITRDGEAMTLVNAYRARVSFNFRSDGMRQPEQLVSTLLIVGAHVGADTRYPRATFRVPALQIWLSRRIIDETRGKNEETGQFTLGYRVAMPPEETARLEAIGAELGWSVRFSSKADAFLSIAVTTTGWISIRPDVPQTLEWFFEQLTKVTTLLTFLAGGAMLADCMKISIGHEGRAASVLVPRPDAKHWAPAGLRDFFMPHHAMGLNLDGIMKRWFEVYPKLQTPSQLALSVMVSEKLWEHIEFLSLIQALEGIHRALYNGEYMNAVDYEKVECALRRAIPSSISSDHRDALRSRIHYGHQFSLAKRLGELAQKLCPPLRAMILGPGGRVPQKWIDTRNYYTHWDDNLRQNILDGQDMIDANVRMRHFLRALYLDLAGIPQQSIFEALRNTSAESQHLIQINTMALRRRDPTSKAGLLMTVSEEEAPSSSDPLSAQDFGTVPPEA